MTNWIKFQSALIFLNEFVSPLFHPWRILFSPSYIAGKLRIMIHGFKRDKVKCFDWSFESFVKHSLNSGGDPYI